MLLISPKLIGGLALELKGEFISKPYIEMTLHLLNNLGVKTNIKSNLISVDYLEQIQKTNIINELFKRTKSSTKSSSRTN